MPQQLGCDQGVCNKCNLYIVKHYTVKKKKLKIFGLNAVLILIKGVHFNPRKLQFAVDKLNQVIIDQKDLIYSYLNVDVC